VYAIVHAAVRRALGRFNIVPSLDFEPEPAIIAAFASAGSSPSTSTAVPAWRPTDLGAFNPPPRNSPEGWQQLFDLPNATPSGTEAPDVNPPRIMAMREHEGMPGERPVFQLHGAYILAQVRSGFMVVDQQRAHERILYERNLKNLEQGAGLSQAELFPRNVELNASDMALVQELLPDLRALGLDIELFGGRTVQVNGMPAEAPDDDPVRLLESVLEHLKNEKGVLRNDRHQALARGLARSMAMRPGQVMASAEMHDLIDRLFACANPTHTPSGKPTLITFGLDELNERFQR
jgi:DNA mismatch repair protein MutL